MNIFKEYFWPILKIYYKYKYITKEKKKYIETTKELELYNQTFRSSLEECAGTEIYHRYTDPIAPRSITAQSLFFAKGNIIGFEGSLERVLATQKKIKLRRITLKQNYEILNHKTIKLSVNLLAKALENIQNVIKPFNICLIFDLPIKRILLVNNKLLFMRSQVDEINYTYTNYNIAYRNIDRFTTLQNNNIRVGISTWLSDLQVPDSLKRKLRRLKLKWILKLNIPQKILSKFIYPTQNIYPLLEQRLSYTEIGTFKTIPKICSINLDKEITITILTGFQSWRPIYKTIPLLGKPHNFENALKDTLLGVGFLAVIYAKVCLKFKDLFKIYEFLYKNFIFLILNYKLFKLEKGYVRIAIAIYTKVYNALTKLDLIKNILLTVCKYIIELTSTFKFYIYFIINILNISGICYIIIQYFKENTYRVYKNLPILIKFSIATGLSYLVYVDIMVTNIFWNDNISYEGITCFTFFLTITILFLVPKYKYEIYKNQVYIYILIVSTFIYTTPLYRLNKVKKVFKRISYNLKMGNEIDITLLEKPLKGIVEHTHNLTYIYSGTLLLATIILVFLTLLLHQSLKEKSLLTAHEFSYVSSSENSYIFKNIFEELFFESKDKLNIETHKDWLDSSSKPALLLEGKRKFTKDHLKYYLKPEYMVEYDQMILDYVEKIKVYFYQKGVREEYIKKRLFQEMGFRYNMIFPEDPETKYGDEPLFMPDPIPLWEDRNEWFEDYWCEGTFNDCLDFIYYFEQYEKRKSTLLKKNKTNRDIYRIIFDDWFKSKDDLIDAQEDQLVSRIPFTKTKFDTYKMADIRDGYVVWNTYDKNIKETKLRHKIKSKFTGVDINLLSEMELITEQVLAQKLAFILRKFAIKEGITSRLGFLPSFDANITSIYRALVEDPDETATILFPASDEFADNPITLLFDDYDRIENIWDGYNYENVSNSLNPATKLGSVNYIGQYLDIDSMTTRFLIEGRRKIRFKEFDRYDWMINHLKIKRLYLKPNKRKFYNYIDPYPSYAKSFELPGIIEDISYYFKNLNKFLQKMKILPKKSKFKYRSKETRKGLPKPNIVLRLNKPLSEAEK